MELHLLPPPDDVVLLGIKVVGITNRKTVQCRGCTHADIHVISVYKAVHPLSFLGREANELTIYCKLKGYNVRYPWEQCNMREERPKVPIDQW